MTISDINLIFDFNYWANDLLLTKAALLQPEQLTQAVDFPFSNLQGTLAHILDSEYVWRTLCSEQRFTGRLLDKVTFPDLESLRAYWKQEETRMRAYLSKLSDSDLGNPIRYEADGNTRERILWHCLWHLVNHGTQHRSQCAAMLKGFGQSPGSMDFTHFLNLRAAGQA
ncbi:MAG: DinB family protein [Trueperaceae bacterium]|nr:DinB family protein [Trueperaceae bacterium]